ncbi:MAG TPA: CDP-alcohol phosphatidyltransferase family protein [Polyangiaceae bacterium]|nr:CDP-alcohol phosphatidyltransferase family protein [Polyangiaceae bacterium]
MAFWDGYWKSLKPLSVEEPIDVWVHRPLAYLLARAAYPTPISPNLITLCSIVLGLFAAYCMFEPFPRHLQVAGLALFSSAVFDCADGQLARLRGSSSAFGRMLDGVADLIVSTATVAGGTYVVWQHFREPWWHGVIALVMCIVTIVTGSTHTATYDHYKNLFLRMTHATFREGEDYESALERYRSRRGTGSLAERAAWPFYLFYMSRQTDFIRGFDPNTKLSLSKLPPYTPESAAVYSQHCEPSMRHWRRWFGFGSLVFGISVSLVFDVVQYYMLFRLLVLNAFFYGFMRPAQRAASKAAFQALGL